MDTRMLDVAIGLTLLFALASLLGTAVQELWASYFNTRGEINQKAIQSMLGSQSGLLKLIYDHPLVRSLQQDDKRVPSFIPSDIFSTVLLHVVADGSGRLPRQGTPTEFLNAVGQAGGALASGSAGLMTVLSGLSAGVENDWPGFEQRIQAWYDHTGGRSLGWFKRKTTRSLFFFGLVLAVLMNLDAVTIGRTLWDDPAARQRVVEVAKAVAAVRDAASAPPSSPAPASHAADAASGSAPAKAGKASSSGQAAALPPMAESLSQAFKDELEADIERASGGQKSVRQQRWLTMSRLTSAHRVEALIRRDAPDTVAGQEALRQAQMASDHQAKMLLDSFPRGGTDQLAADRDGQVSLRARAEVVIKALQADRKPLPAPIVPSSVAQGGSAPVAGAALCQGLAVGVRDSCLASCKDLVGPQGDVCRSTYALQAVHDAGIPLGWTDSALANFRQGDVWAIVQMMVGWLLTAIAVTLGAPFWFDTLSKLVKVRGAGSTADDAKASSAPNVAATTSVTGVQTPAAVHAEGFSDALNDAEKALTVDQVSSIQMALGLPNAQITGRLDFATRDAIKVWQRDQQLPVSGLLSTHEIQLLLTKPATSVNPVVRTGPSNDGYEG